MEKAEKVLQTTLKNGQDILRNIANARYRKRLLKTICTVTETI